MKFYCYGNKNNPPIMLFPGTWCLHTSFSEVIPLLEKSFYVIAVSYNGFDETEDTVFLDMITETEKVDDILYSELPKAEFLYTEQIGRGGSMCDYTFKKR